jgi:hypothetical protein
MSKISQVGRSFEVFDPSNRTHREIFHDAVKNRTWGRSPVRFWVDAEQTDLLHQCTQKMAHWYMQQEFGEIKA